jgi:GxxExxY protein
MTHRVIGAAMEVHRVLGPGLLESAYEACLAAELQEAGFRVQSQVPLPLVYKNVRVDCGYRIDIIVDDRLILEVKAVDELAPIHQQQLLSYLRLSRRPLGLLINFNVPILKDGIHRVINGVL